MANDARYSDKYTCQPMMMRRSSVSHLACAAFCLLSACPAPLDGDGNEAGEGEGEHAAVGEGEGEPVAEGEGEGEPLPESCSDDTNKTLFGAPNAVYFGSRQPALVPLDAAQMNAVVAIGEAGFAGVYCSGTLISADVVLTAQHCTIDVPASMLRVFFGVDEDNPLLVLAGSSKLETDEDTDVALVRLQSAPAEQIDVRPISITREAPDAAAIGTLLEQAGYGETHDGSTGRYFVTETFEAFDDDFIVVNGGGQRGVCFGDSGGPSLHLSSEGDVRVLGVLSFGDVTCGNHDSYARVDTLRTLIETMTGETPLFAPEACPPSLTEEGSCSIQQARASFCEAEHVVHDACALGEICAADDNARFRCVPVAENPCGQVTRFGACNDETLTWCDGGVVKARACADCAERCLLASEAEGFACVPSDCGALDRQGECAGTTARWCSLLGALEEADCADGCAYIGPEYGYYCVDEAACEGHTYQGDCAGDVLTWCEDYEVVSINCAADGLSCGFVDEETGYDCL